MKKLFVILFVSIFFGSSLVYAQILKEHKQYLLDGNVINYTTQYETLSGVFLVTKGVEKKEIIRGNYLNGKKKGNWYYFNYDGTLFLRYNFDSNKVYSLDAKSLTTFSVKINASDDLKTLASVPIPLWSFDSFYVLATEYATKAVESKHLSRLSNKDVAIIADVSDDGRAKYYVSYKLDNKEIKKEFIIIDRVLEIDWLPAIYKDQKFSSMITFKTKLNTNQSNNDGGHKRMNWN